MRGTMPEELKKEGLKLKETLKIGELEIEDHSSYSRGDNERIPNIFKIKNLEFLVIYNHVQNPDEFVFTYRNLAIERMVLNSKTWEEAFKEAIKIAHEKAENLQKLLYRTSLKIHHANP